MAEVVSRQAATRRWVLAAVVALLGMVPFWGAVRHGYSRFDDMPMLGTTAYHGLGPEQLSWMFTTVHMGHYQPLAWVTFAIEWTLCGELRADVSHAVNIVVHGVNAALVFVLATMLIGRARPELPRWAVEVGAAGAALLFAVHPLRVESVAWVTERRDVLSLLFYLLAVMWYLRANDEGVGKTERGRRMLGVWLFFVLSLLSKAWGMTFFLVLLVIDWYPLRRVPWPGRAWLSAPARKVLMEKLPFAVVGVVWAVVAGMAASSYPGTSKKLVEWGVDDRVFQAVYGLAFYWWKTVWPTGLSVLYELPRELKVTELRVLAALGTVLVGVAAAVALRRKWPAVPAALAAFAVIVSPVLGLFQSGIQLVADRYSYLSMIAPVVALGGWMAVWMSRRTVAARWGMAGCVVVLAGVLSALTVRQTSYWREDVELFGHAMASGQDGPILRVYYGKQLDRVGRPEEAVRHFQRAIELAPDYGEAWFALGNACKASKQIDEAKRAYERAIALLPDSWRADQAMGLLLAEELDDLEGALAYFKSAVEKIEGKEHWAFQPGPYMTLASALYDLGDVAGARQALEIALQFRETHELAKSGLRKIGAGR
ncbi:MAG: tetratricopeptide repeat protein [Phycisphaeraceae bacterium]|nr:tetratricopeptide repeat protein [Phycisphaeraceae bacterium]